MKSAQSIEKNIYLRIIEFGIKKPKGFTCEQIIENRDLKLKDWEKKIIEKYLYSAYLNAQQTKVHGKSSSIETPFLAIESGEYYSHGNSRYIISFDSYFKYLDYEELKFARKAAGEAKNLSLKAIIVAGLAIIVSIIIPVLMVIFITQQVSIDPEQLQEIKNSLSQLGR